MAVVLFLDSLISKGAYPGLVSATKSKVKWVTYGHYNRAIDAIPGEVGTSDGGSN